LLGLRKTETIGFL